MTVPNIDKNVERDHWGFNNPLVLPLPDQSTNSNAWMLPWMKEKKVKGKNKT
jgi:hypothetical protein